MERLYYYAANHESNFIKIKIGILDVGSGIEITSPSSHLTKIVFLDAILITRFDYFYMYPHDTRYIVNLLGLRTYVKQVRIFVNVFYGSPICPTIVYYEKSKPT